MVGRDLQVRNSTINFLVLTEQDSTDSIQVRVHGENVWSTQKSMTQLFKCSIDNTSLHLKNIFRDGEPVPETVIEKLSAAASGGKQYKTKFYNLDAVISVGYRINSSGATQFRQWVTEVLRTCAMQGYVLDEKRLENGQIFDEKYFKHLLDEIGEIRASERRSYQKITDTYATAVDYSKGAVITKKFFETIQNKLHYAIHGHTAAEAIAERADHKREHMGLTTWKNAPGGKIVKANVSIVKNYLSQSELQDLNQFVSMYLDYAERQAKKHTSMTMEDWATKLEVFLKMNDKDILLDKGRVTHEIVKAFAESEFERYRVV